MVHFSIRPKQARAVKVEVDMEGEEDDHGDEEAGLAPETRLVVVEVLVLEVLLIRATHFRGTGIEVGSG